MQRHRRPFSQHPASPALLLLVRRIVQDDMLGTYQIPDADPYIPGGNGAEWYINQSNLQVSINYISAHNDLYA